MPFATLRFLIRCAKSRYRDHKVETRSLLEALRPGDAAIDVGANKGSFVYPLARAVGRSGRVLAFEPQQQLAAYLRTMVARCRLPQVEVSSVALSDSAGHAALFAPAAGHSPGATLVDGAHVPTGWVKQEIETTTLDAAAAGESRRIGALKIDVEGHEMAVLRGAEATLARHRPVVVFECEERHLTACCVGDVLAWLAERGYVVQLVDHGRLVPGSEYRPERHQARGPGAFWDHSDYCNNFVATPVERS